MRKSYILIGVALLTLVSCSEDEQKETEEASTRQVTVETQIIQRQPFKQYLKLIGSVEAQNDIRISADVSGRIQKYYVEQGDRIRKGTPILKIDDSKLQRERSRLQAQTKQAKEQYQRTKKVYDEDGVGSEIDVINAKAGYQESKAAMESIEVDIGNSTIRAPFDATVEELLMEQGEMASPGSGLVRLIGNNLLKVSAGVPASYADVITKGDKATVWFDVQQADTLHLPITYVAGSIAPQARTFEVEIKLPPQKESYKVDMSSNIKLETFSRDSAIVVGKEFIYQDGEKDIVYTLDNEEDSSAIAKMTPVELGVSYENRVIINKGLSTGDRLITVGSSFLQD